MRVVRIYQDQVLAVGDTLTLQPAATHHLREVLRARVGQQITLFNGRGGEYLGLVAHISRREVVVALTDYNPDDRLSAFSIRLAPCLVSGDKMDFVIQKCVELGVRRISPCFSERCNVKLKGDRLLKRQQHWQKIIIHACEQCGLNQLPELDAVGHFTELVAEEPEMVVCHPKTKARLSELQIRGESITLGIGPEGGFSDQEVHHCQSLGIRFARLSPRVLRAETASITATAILQHRLGDLA